MKKLTSFFKLKSFQVASLCIVANLIVTAPVLPAESYRTFRQNFGLNTYIPPDWFLNGYFTAREKDPSYVFGPVSDFATKLGGNTTWLIEDVELENIKKASADGKKIEHSLFLEAVLPERTEYWVFVLQPYASAQEWYDARRSYHGRKAEAYYGNTRVKFERALSQGFNISAELRFWIVNKEISLKIPEEVIMSKYNIKPVFDLGTDVLRIPAEKTK